FRSHLHSFPTRRASDLSPEEMENEIREAAGDIQCMRPLFSAAQVQKEGTASSSRGPRRNGAIRSASPVRSEMSTPTPHSVAGPLDRKSTRLNSSHVKIS